jgi:serine/threonine-protein kinase
MTYCLNPDCPQPKNPPGSETCEACGSKLLLRDRYRINRTLGQGGFGATYLANIITLPGDPCCVIKQLRPNTTAPQLMEMARELFEREARTLGRIGNHPQIPSLLDYFEDNHQFYLVQEYVAGYTLQQEVKRNGPFSEAGAKQFLSEILPLLRYIHSQKVIHRDIKPANLIRREQDRKLVMIDFGAVKHSQIDPNVAGGGMAAEQTALTNFAIGTPGFAPPEQMAMRPVYASDFYAVGVTCIYLLTGKSPKDIDYNPATGEMMWQQYVNISDHFANVLKKLLEASVRHRYQSIDDIFRAMDMEPYLDSLAQGLATKSNTPPKPNPVYRRQGGMPSSGDLAGPGSVGSRNSGGAGSMAEAIRARRVRLQQSGGGSPQTAAQLGGNTIGRSRTGLSSSGGKAKPQPKLDYQSFMTAYMKGRRDFAGQDLSLLNFQKIDLSGKIILNQAKLARTNFQEANLTEADFCRASLVGANFQDAILEKAFFHQANLEGAIFRGANLIGANLSQANLKNANLSGANLTGARVTDEQLGQAKMNWLTVLPNGKRAFGKL